MLYLTKKVKHFPVWGVAYIIYMVNQAEPTHAHAGRGAGGGKGCAWADNRARNCPCMYPCSFPYNISGDKHSVFFSCQTLYALPDDLGLFMCLHARQTLWESTAFSRPDKRNEKAYNTGELKTSEHRRHIYELGPP